MTPIECEKIYDEFAKNKGGKKKASKNLTLLINAVKDHNNEEYRQYKDNQSNIDPKDIQGDITKSQILGDMALKLKMQYLFLASLHYDIEDALTRREEIYNTIVNAKTSKDNFAVIFGEVERFSDPMYGTMAVDKAMFKKSVVNSGNYNAIKAYADTVTPINKNLVANAVSERAGASSNADSEPTL